MATSIPSSRVARHRIVVVGAGIAGLTAARRIKEAGCDVLVLEKSRGPGGRAATRRSGSDQFDHGAQYFSCRTDAFCEQVTQWQRQGCVQPWRSRIVAIAEAAAEPRVSAHSRFVGVPGMNAIGRALADGLDCRYNARVASLQSGGGEWQIELSDGKRLAADVVVLALPPAQAAALLTPIDTPLLARLTEVEMQPCWALMLAFAEALPASFDAAFIDADAHAPLAWCARDTAKPGRPTGERWVIHAQGDWSARHLDMPDDAVAEVLGAAFGQLVSAPLAPLTKRVHRWRYAQAANPLDEACLYDANFSLAVAGDWCAGSRIEGAWLSGVAAAARLTQNL